jgi:hypothetical protein
LICLSSKDLEILKQQKQISGFILVYDNIWKFLLKTPKKKIDVSGLLFSKKFKKIELNLSREDIQHLLKRGLLQDRIGSTNVYFYSENHDPERFNEKCSCINILFFQSEEKGRFPQSLL